MKYFILLIFTSTFATEYLIKFKDNSKANFLKSKAIRSFKSSNQTIYVVDEVSKPDYGDQAIVEPNHIYKIQGHFKKYIKAIKGKSTNDPMINQLWGLNNKGERGAVSGADIDAFKAWKIHKGSKDIVIAVIDTGVDYNHPDLKNQIWENSLEVNGQEGVDDDGNGFVDDYYGYDFANNDNDPMDGNGHGTHCSGTIGAAHNNGIGVAGVMANVKILPLKFLTDRGSGTLENAIKAIDYAVDKNVDIMSNSWGGGGYSQLLKESIERARDKGIIFVAAAGNSTQDNDKRPTYPVSYKVDNIVGVSAHTKEDKIASFSSYGKNTMHIMAPGKDIVSTVNRNRYASYSGTSMATPHVSGALGLLLSKTSLDYKEVISRLLKTSEPVPAYRSKVQAKGRLNSYNLLVNYEPPRNDPDPDLWERVALNEIVESNHPYTHREQTSHTLSVPGVKFIRLVIKKAEIENRFDFLKLYNPADQTLVESLSGTYEDYQTEYLSGDTVNLLFTSDGSVSKWGYLIEEVEVIR